MIPSPIMPWVLVVETGDRPRRLPLSVEVSVAGSGSAVDLLLDHPTVSRRHARLSPSAEGVWLVDLGSSNGTRVDGVAVTSRILVQSGQTVHFGSLSCALELTDAAELEPAIDFGSASVPSVETLGSDALGTLTVGSVREFLRVALPAIVSRLEARRDRPRAASAESLEASLEVIQEAGRALFHSFPIESLEIVEKPSVTELKDQSDQLAVLFRAGEEGKTGSASVDRLRVAAGRLETRVRFVPGLHVSGILPLIELVTRLAALDFPDTVEPVPAPRPQALPVALPAPATIDPHVRRIYEDARRVARGDVGVLIAGESGTGKEVLAKFVHRASPRAGGQLVALNCAALPQDLLEAELFGIERGVATGVEARSGKFEQADGGSLFLDEIGDMAPSTQAKILRVLQEGEVYRLGGRSPRPARVRIIAATNRDLPTMIDDGAFRLDLYHRIADCRFTLPPLRDRLGDLPNLAAHFLVHAASEQGIHVRGISKAALEALMAFSWPGNIRQLEREMARAALFLEDGELLQGRHLHGEIAVGSRFEMAGGDRSLRGQLERFERSVILGVLAGCDGSVRAAADELGIGRTTLYRRLRELEIEF